MNEVEITRLFWYRINVLTKRGGERAETLYWEMLPFQVRTKWDWYFKYRAALLQVKYPRFEVDQHWGSVEKVDAEEIRRKNDITRLKGKITKLSNKAEEIEKEAAAMRKNWNQLFPIEEDPEFNRLHIQLAAIDMKGKELLKELETKQKGE